MMSDATTNKDFVLGLLRAASRLCRNIVYEIDSTGLELKLDKTVPAQAASLLIRILAVGDYDESESDTSDGKQSSNSNEAAA